MENKKISILGCGWYGLALAKELVKEGYHVNGSTTTAEKLVSLQSAGITPFLINFDGENAQYSLDFFDCDILFIAIPPKSRSPHVAEYVTKIKAIAQIATKAKVKQVIFISSSGIYPDGNFIVDETDIPEPRTASGKALQDAENTLIKNLNFEPTIIRFSGLIGPGRNLSKHFAGKKEIPNGLAPVNLIHQADCIGLSLAIIQQKAFGKIYHGVSPSHPTKQDFYTKATLASGLERPEFLEERLAWKQIESKNVPEVLAYEYVFKKWNKYFEELK